MDSLQSEGKCEIKVSIYDSSGRRVRTLDLGFKEAGFYTSREKAVYWDGRNETGELIAGGQLFRSAENVDSEIGQPYYPTKGIGFIL